MLRIRSIFNPWIRDKFFFQIPDLGSPIHISESLETIFWVKNLHFFVYVARIVFYLIQNHRICDVCEIHGTKKVTKLFVPPLLLLLDSGSEKDQDSRSEKNQVSGFLNKIGSATLKKVRRISPPIRLQDMKTMASSSLYL